MTDLDVTSESLPGRAGQLLILCNNNGGTDLSVRLTEYTVMGRPYMSVGSLGFKREDVLAAADAGWIEITNEERAGMVCRPSEEGYEWLIHYRARQLQKGRAQL